METAGGRARHMKDLRTSTHSPRDPSPFAPYFKFRLLSRFPFCPPLTKPPPKYLFSLPRFAVSDSSVSEQLLAWRRLPRSSSMETLVMLCKQTHSFIHLLFCVFTTFPFHDVILLPITHCMFSFLMYICLYFLLLYSIKTIQVIVVPSRLNPSRTERAGLLPVMISCSDRGFLFID